MSESFYKTRLSFWSLLFTQNGIQDLFHSVRLSGIITGNIRDYEQWRSLYHGTIESMLQQPKETPISWIQDAPRFHGLEPRSRRFTTPIINSHSLLLIVDVPSRMPMSISLLKQDLLLSLRFNSKILRLGGLKIIYVPDPIGQEDILLRQSPRVLLPWLRLLLNTCSRISIHLIQVRALPWRSTRT